MSRRTRPPKPVEAKGGLPCKKQGVILEASGDPRLDRIADGVDKLVNGMDKLVEAIPKPASHWRRILEAILTIIAIGGILSAVDVIINWIGG